MNKKYYTGIGSRKTPENILDLMTDVAEILEKEGYILRSGGAEGADSAFEAGVQNPQNKEIFIPWDNFNDRNKEDKGVFLLPAQYRKAEEVAKSAHPAWDKCSDGVKKLHARNVYQIMGQNMKTLSELVIFWAPLDSNGNPTGGTATAVKIAESKGIRVINLNTESNFNGMTKFLKRGDR